MKTTIIYHSGDFDGLFSREALLHFIPDAKTIGWDYGHPPVPLPEEGLVIIVDLTLDEPFGEIPKGNNRREIVWIDHHKSALEKFSHLSLPGFRIDGVAACRLAWQWGKAYSGLEMGPVQERDTGILLDNPTKEAFIARTVDEPLAIRLAGEYDVWDKRDPNGELFQLGLHAQGDNLTHEFFQRLLELDRLAQSIAESDGARVQAYKSKIDAMTMGSAFMVEFEGLRFLAITGMCNSLTFTTKDVPETGHDALMGIKFNGRQWTISLYHARHNTEIDLSMIANKYGGGGHRGACGFQVRDLDQILPRQ